MDIIMPDSLSVADSSSVDRQPFVSRDEISELEAWAFRVDCAGVMAPDAELIELIDDAPDPGHSTVAYLAALLDGRHTERVRNQLATQMVKLETGERVPLIRAPQRGLFGFLVGAGLALTIAGAAQAEEKAVGRHLAGDTLRFSEPVCAAEFLYSGAGAGPAVPVEKKDGELRAKIVSAPRYVFQRDPAGCPADSAVFRRVLAENFITD
jgi:hypothetical protein